MTKGCVIFAFNNNTFDYVKLANYAASNIERHLHIPTTLITNTNVDYKHNFENVIIIDKPDHGTRYFSDIKGNVKWVNYGRYKVYELSPYDETILLDADYIVASNQLSLLFESNKDLLCHSTAYDITGNHNFTALNHFGIYNMPMDWATVLYFKKSKDAEIIFQSMEMIQDNYIHYANLYNFHRYPFRNDYALSIALNISNGHFMNDDFYIKWNLASVMPDHYISQLEQDVYEIKFPIKDNKFNRVIVKNKDLHAMGKKYLTKLYED